MRSAIPIALGVALFVAITACAGYTVDDYIDVPVPQGVQDKAQVGPRVPLSEAKFTRERYVNAVTTDLAQFDESISDARLFSEFVGSLVNTGLEVSAGPIQSLPMGGAIFGVLGGLAGLFLNKPGTAKKIEQAKREEHEKTWDAAVKETMANLQAAKAEQ